MNAPDSLHLGINLTEIMEREGIHAIKRWPAGRFSVELDDGSFASAHTVGEAVSKARLPGADNVRQVRKIAA